MTVLLVAAVVIPNLVALFFYLEARHLRRQNRELTRLLLRLSTRAPDYDARPFSTR